MYLNEIPCVQAVMSQNKHNSSYWFNVVDSSEWPRQSIIFCVQVKILNSLCFLVVHSSLSTYRVLQA